MLHSLHRLVTDERSQLAIIAIGLLVSSAPYGVQIFAVIALAVTTAATSTRARSVWRALPTRSPS